MAVEGVDNLGYIKIVDEHWPKYNTDQNGNMAKDEAKKMLINIACENYKN